MKLRFSKFKEEDFLEYQSWYEDADLNQRLGPMDEKWLQHVMKATDGCEYSVFLDRELVAVVGIKFPNPQHPAFYITDFALKPHLRSQGIGSSVLRELLMDYPSSDWRVFVDVKNPRAKLFFEKNGWVCLSGTPDGDDMFELQFNA